MTKLPPEFLNSLLGLPGFDAPAFESSHATELRPTSIRLNPFKPVGLTFNNTQPVPWCSHGYYLNERPYFTHDPLFQAGAYYVQEAGSMFIETALRQHVDLTTQLVVLDACAAPGGKSTLVNALLNENSLLVANETVKTRAGILTENLGRWGTANTVVTNSSTDRFRSLGETFDAMVVDAPCSGSGLFRKQPEAIEEWSLSAVEACSVRQKTILSDVLPTLKENGILIYSTCSYSARENEDIVQWLIDTFNMHYVPVSLDASWGIVDSGLGYRFYPHLSKSEGFFCAVLRKQGEGEHMAFKSSRTQATLSKNDTQLAEQYVDTKNLELLGINGKVHAMNRLAGAFLGRYDKHLYFRKAGTLVGEIKGKDLVPAQDLAWSIHLKNDVRRIELTAEDAVNYLKKADFLKVLPEPGLVLVSHAGLGLGWAKILPNRVNNYLPNELRILK